MYRTIVYIIVALTFLRFPAMSARDAEAADIQIVPECDKNTYFSNETGKLTIWLYTQNPNVNGISEISPLNITDGGFSYLTRVADSSNTVRKSLKGKEYYAIPIATYAFMIKDTGKFNISAGDYKVGVAVPSIVHDPFYGNVKALKTSVIDVSGQNTKVKVKNLPDNNNSELFSGAIGDYAVEVIVPEGEIIVNEPATVFIRISGTGFIGNDTMPDYHKAFSRKLRLKSVNEKNDYYYDGYNVISEKILECEIIPTERDNVCIDSVEFGFFNPNTKKYETAKSKIVPLDVKSSTVKIVPFDI